VPTATAPLPYDFYAPDALLHLPGGTVTVEEYVDDCIDAGLVHTVHVSERRAFRNCRQRWNWAYLEDLHEDSSIRALEFGLAYHHAMEKFYDPETWHFDKQVLATFAIAEFDRYTRETYESLTRRGLASEALAEDFADRLEAGRAMLEHYFAEVAPVSDTFQPLKVEVAFEVPLHTPDGELILCKCDRCWDRFCLSPPGLELARTQNIRMPGGKREWEHRAAWLGLPVTIGGRLDLLGEDLETGELGVLDWKTAGVLMTDKEIDFLELDDQISTYLLAMHKLGLDVRTFWYHEQWKASPQPPEPYAGGRVIKGRKYQASKTLGTDYAIYYATVSEGDPAGMAAGAYDEFLEWLRTEGPRYWQRTTVRRNNYQLRATEEAIFFEYLDMVSGRIYPSPERKRCSWCAFYQPCLSKQRGERYDHALKTLYTKGRPSNDMNQPKATQ
jgi:hypothetical protein